MFTCRNCAKKFSLVRYKTGECLFFALRRTRLLVSPSFSFRVQAGKSRGLGSFFLIDDEEDEDAVRSEK